jgi:hypothetical protein
VTDTWHLLLGQLEADLDALDVALDDPAAVRELLLVGVGSVPADPPVAMPSELAPRARRLHDRYGAIEARLAAALGKLRIEMQSGYAAALPYYFDEPL